ncbi:tumor necrosis factor receptor superfamily member 14-like isoform X1 [Notamacropus eugenii]|uniref:tumor necrosis factor receptor superfamily member 14-like isoform X1 n=1 Tax=Notamacropus eugenii TaxID=9315 RepID=UPI003B67FEF2
MQCKVGQYNVDGVCCYPCHAGYRVKGTCSIMTGTMCVPCDPGTYTAHHSGLKECLQCKVCKFDLGFVTRQECSSTSNTVCGCSPGYFCADMNNDDCELCVPHQVCTPGQYVKSQGTERNNTICEKCQEGMFSPNGTLGQCLLWTNCTAHGSFEEKPGTDTTDVLCSRERKNYCKLCLCIGIIIFIFIPFIFAIIFAKRKKDQERGEQRHKEGGAGGLCSRTLNLEGSDQDLSPLGL